MKTNRNKRGQALVELAVFGTFFLLIIGALVSYGVRYNDQQKTEMTAFRRALKIASDPNRGSGSYSIISDKPIPDPSDLYGVGSPTAITSSASVTRDYMGSAQAANGASLPATVTDIQTNRNEQSETWMRRITKTAGFRVEYNVKSKAIKKYRLIYGTILALANGYSVDKAMADPNCNGWVSSNGDYKDKFIHTCDSGSSDCSSFTYFAIRIQDSCSGEYVSRLSCYDQARKIVDAAYCLEQCLLNKIKGSTENCHDECNIAADPNKDLNPPNQFVRSFSSTTGGAWYAADYLKPGEGINHTGGYYFPVLEKLFAYADAVFSSSGVDKTMGIQSDATTETLRDQTLHETQTPTGITTEESAGWSDATNRDFIYQNNLYPANDPQNRYGYETLHSTPAEFVNVQVEPVYFNVSGNITRTLETGQ